MTDPSLSSPLEGGNSEVGILFRIVQTLTLIAGFLRSNSDRSSNVLHSRGISLLVASILMVALAGPVHGQLLQGRVIDRAAGVSIPSASVRLVEMPTGKVLSDLTNESGLFQFQVTSEGPYVLDVFALGYITYVDTLRVPPKEEQITLEVRMGIDAIPLDPLEVTASRSPWWEVTEPRMVWDYHRRKDYQGKLGLGKFFDQDQLEAMFPAGDLSIFTEIWPPRAESSSISLRGASCDYTYYVDGLKWNGTLEEIPFRTSDLYSVELYRGPSEIPGEFLSSNSRCGVMVFWTWRSSRIG